MFHGRYALIAIVILTCALSGIVVAGTVSGTITSDEAGNPVISGALVRTEGDPSYSNTTASNGTYSITVAAGTYSILASAAGHTPQRVNLSIGGGAAVAQNFALRVSGSTGSPVQLPAPLDWGEPPAASSAPGDNFPLYFPDMSAGPVAGAPQISGWSEIVKPDESFTLTGSGFTTRTGVDAGTDTTVWIWARTSSSGGVLRQAKVWRVTENTLTATVPSDVSFGMYLVWVENSNGPSSPICLNKTTATWVGPLGNAVQAGNRKRVFGRNISYNHGTAASYVYIQPASGGAMTSCTVNTVNPYMVEFTVPGGTTAGNYKVYVHSGHGGVYGWSDGLDLVVQDDWVRDAYETVLNPSGGDDTAAIQNAINTVTARANGGTVRLASGTFKSYDQLWVKGKVRLAGAGIGSTIVELRSNTAGRHDYVRVHGDHINIENLTLKACLNSANPPVYGILEGPYPEYPTTEANDIKYLNVSLSADEGTILTQNNLGYSRVEADGCSFFRQIDAGVCDGWMHNCNLYGGPYGSTSPYFETEGAFYVGSRIVFEGSHIETQNWPIGPGGSRNYKDFMQPAYYAYKVWAKRVSLYNIRSHSYTSGLTTTDVAVQDGKGEMILLHSMSGQWFGNPVSIDGLTMNVRTDGTVNGQTVDLHNYYVPLTGGQPVPDSKPSNIPLDGNWAVVISGKGMGQARQVVSHTSTSITVDRPWRVAPDSASLVMVTPQYVDHVVYNNDLNAFPSGYVQTTSASVGIDIDGNGNQVFCEANTSRRTNYGRYICANSGGPTYWCSMRDESAVDCHASGYRSFWWDENPVGRMLLGNAYHNSSVNVTDTAEDGAMAMLGEGSIAENFSSTSTVGYKLSGVATSASYQDGYTLFRKGSIAVTGSPSSALPVFVTQNSGKQALIGNTYSGGSQNYWYGVGASSYCQPTALNGVARFNGYKDTVLPQAVIPIANSGTQTVTWTASPSDNWITAAIQQNGCLSAENDTGELAIAVDPTSLSTGVTWGSVTVSGGGQSVKVGVRVELAASVPTSGLQLWLKSNAGVTKDGSNYVGTWADQSGNGRNATQATQGYKPLWVSNAVNGYPVIRFAGTDDVLATASRPVDGTTAFSTFTVNRWSSFTLSNGYQRMWWEGSTSATNGYGAYIDSAATPQIKAGWPASAVISDSNTAQLSNWYLTTTTYDQSNHRMWVNGISKGTSAKTNSNINTGVLNVGNYNTNNQGFNGDLTEILMYNRVVSSAERARIEAYLTAKYFSPVASFTANPGSGAPPLTVSFDATASTAPAGSISDYSWRFGDGATGTGATTSHQYTACGLYPVTLIITDSHGNTSTARTSVTVNGPYAVSLAANLVSPVAPGTAVVLTATATGGSNREYKFMIDSGGGWTSLRDWASGATCNWTPAAAGNHKHQVLCRESGNPGGYEVASNVLPFSAYNGTVSWDLATDYGTTANPNGQWSYGFTTGIGLDTFTAFTVSGRWSDYYGMRGWYNTRGAGQYDEPPCWVGKNTNGAMYYALSPGKVGLRPKSAGSTENRAVARFTAPATAYYTFVGSFVNNNGQHINGYGVAVDKANYLFGGNYSGQTGSNIVPICGVASISAASTLDFVGSTGPSEESNEVSQIDATIKMGRWAVSGYVEDANHVRLSGARVERVSGTESVTTDTAGNYTLVILNSGNYSIKASKPAFEPVTASGVVVDGTAVVTQNFTLPLGVTISGVVTENTTGSPVLQSVKVVTLDGVYSTTTDTAGQYGMQVTRGNYSVNFYKYGYVPNTSAVNASSGNVQLNVALDKGWDLAADFNNTVGNPNGVWSYGYANGSVYSLALYSSMTAAGHWSCNSYDIDWHAAFSSPGYYAPALWKLNSYAPIDQTTSVAWYGGPAYREALKVIAMPSGKVASAVSRFKAPNAGVFRVTARFAGTKQVSPYTKAKVALMYRENYIFGGPSSVKQIDGFVGRSVNNYTDSAGTGIPVYTYMATIALASGDTLDAIVLNDIDHPDLGGRGDTEGWIQVDLTVNTINPATSWDIASDFKTASNPNGQWSYGCTSGTDMSTFSCFTMNGGWGNWSAMQTWHNTRGGGQWDQPPLWVGKNTAAVAQYAVDAGKVGLRPSGSGGSEKRAIARFSAPGQGYYTFAGVFKNANGFNHTNGYSLVVDRSSVLFDGTFTGQTGSGLVPVYGVVNAGTAGTIDFVGRTGPSDDSNEVSQVDATIKIGQWAVQGYVQDANNNRLSGARVERVGGNESTVTDTAGNYTLVIMTPGNYNVKASRSGFEPSTSNGVVLDGSSVAVRNFTLSLGVTISGTVTENSLNSPVISGVKVVTSDGLYSATTNTAGQYSLQVTRGSYNVGFYKYSYVPKTVTANVSTGNATANAALDKGWDLAADFASTGNPNGVWTYGYASGTAYSQALFSSMTYQGHWSCDSYDIDWHALVDGVATPGYYSPAFWKLNQYAPVDQTGGVAWYGGPSYREAMKVIAMPSGKVRSSVARFTAPSAGTHVVTVRFAGEKQVSPYTKAKVALMYNNGYIYGGPSSIKQIDGFVGRSINNYTDSAGTGTPVYTYTTTLTLASGDVLDAVVLNDIDHADQGGWGNTDGWVQVDLTLTSTGGDGLLSPPGELAQSMTLVDAVRELKSRATGSMVVLTTPVQLASATAGDESFVKRVDGGVENYFFIQSDDGVRGMKCVTDGGLAAHGPSCRIAFTGVIGKDSIGQKVVNVTSIDSVVDSSGPRPIGKVGNSVTNTGSLIRVWGTITEKVMNIGSDSGSCPVDYYVINDGSGDIRIPMRVTSNSMRDDLRVGDFIAVTGIATTATGSDVVVMPRTTDDIQKMTSDR